MRRITSIPPDSERCADNFVPNANGWDSHRCYRRGTLKENGKLWCKQHAPSSVEMRRKASGERYAAARAEKAAPYHERDRLRTINADLLAALKATIPWLEAMSLPYNQDTRDRAARDLEAAHAAIARAKEAP